MDFMICAPGELIELLIKHKNPYDDNAVAVWSKHGKQLGQVSAELAPMISKCMKEDDTIAFF